MRPSDRSLQAVQRYKEQPKEESYQKIGTKSKDIPGLTSIVRLHRPPLTNNSLFPSTCANAANPGEHHNISPDLVS